MRKHLKLSQAAFNRHFIALKVLISGFRVKHQTPTVGHIFQIKKMFLFEWNIVNVWLYFSQLVLVSNFKYSVYFKSFYKLLKTYQLACSFHFSALTTFLMGNL